MDTSNTQRRDVSTESTDDSALDPDVAHADPVQPDQDEPSPGDSERPSDATKGGRIDRLRPEVLFLPLFLMFGAVMVFLVPPGWNSDEPAHFMRAWQLSSGQILPELQTDDTGQLIVGGNVPTGIVTLLKQNHLWSEPRVFQFDSKVANLHDDSDAIAAAASTDPLTTVDFRNSAIYSPLAYAPGVVGFWIGDLLGLSFASIMFLGRALDLIVLAAGVFLAIRITPVAKWAFFVVALLPGFVYQGASFSADPMVLAMCLVFTAFVLRLIGQPHPLSTKQIVLLGLLAVGVPLTKVAYGPFLLLILLIPLCNRQQRHRRGFLTAAGLIVLGVIPALIWTRVTGYANAPLNPAANLPEQIKYVLTDPLSYGATLFRTFVAGDMDLLYTSIFGNFIWLSAPIPLFFIIIGTAALLGALLVEDPRETFELQSVGSVRTFRYGIIGIVAASTLVLASAIYATFSTFRAVVVEGFQARYLLPLLPALMAALSGNVVIRQGPMKIFLVVSVVLVLFGGVLTLYRRLY